MIFVDTGAWFAISVATDPHHQVALQWLNGNNRPFLTTDYVIDETLTLLKVRGEGKRAQLAAKRLFVGMDATIHFLTESEIRTAADIFRRFSDKDWSFTDCTSKAVMERLGITKAFAFDHHFRQFGGIAVVP